MFNLEEYSVLVLTLYFLNETDKYNFDHNCKFVLIEVLFKRILPSAGDNVVCI